MSWYVLSSEDSAHSATRRRRTMGRNFENRKNAIFKTAAQKSKLYSKYGTRLYVAAKNGVADLDANPALRSLIEKAKRDQVPAHVIEKALEKARGAGGEDFVSARYEGFGPGGSLVIVDCLMITINVRLRTSAIVSRRPVPNWEPRVPSPIRLTRWRSCLSKGRMKSKC